VILHQIDAGRRYDVYVHSSFAGYLWNWLERAAGGIRLRRDRRQRGGTG
jgi:sarcosine oxidase gamma subunit